MNHEDEKRMREEIIAQLSKRYEKMPDCPDKHRILHLIRVNVRSIPYADLKIKWFETVGQNGS
jgi:hypothetical protein